jgi:superfamily II DNA helicase RecQ/superfamily I DNA/RNA helicase
VKLALEAADFPERQVYLKHQRDPDAALVALLHGQWMDELQPALLAFEPDRNSRLRTLAKFANASAAPETVIRRAMVGIDTETAANGEAREIGFARTHVGGVMNFEFDPRSALGQAGSARETLLREIAACRPFMVGHNLVLHDRRLLREQWGVDLAALGFLADSLLIQTLATPWGSSHALSHHAEAHKAGADAAESLKLVVKSLDEASPAALRKLVTQLAEGQELWLAIADLSGTQIAKLAPELRISNLGDWCVCSKGDVRAILWAGLAKLTSESTLEGDIPTGEICPTQARLQRLQQGSADERAEVLFMVLLKLIDLANARGLVLYRAMLPDWFSGACEDWLEHVVVVHPSEAPRTRMPKLLTIQSAVTMAARGDLLHTDLQRLFQSMELSDWVGAICRRPISRLNAVDRMALDEHQLLPRAISVPSVVVDESGSSIESGQVACPYAGPEQIDRPPFPKVSDVQSAQVLRKVIFPSWQVKGEAREACADLWPDTNAYVDWVEQCAQQLLSLAKNPSLGAGGLVVICGSADSRNRLEDILAGPGFGIAQPDHERSVKARLQRVLRGAIGAQVLLLLEHEYRRAAPAISEFSPAERARLTVVFLKVPIELWIDWLPPQRSHVPREGVGGRELARLRTVIPAWIDLFGLPSDTAMVILDARVPVLNLVQGVAVPVELLELSGQQRLHLDAELSALPRRRSSPFRASLDEYRAFLRQHWGYEDFRARQIDGMKAIAESSESLLLMLPTGEGKSVMFQVPALMHGRASGKLSIICMPLKALMKDQIENVPESLKSQVAYLSSDMPWWERAGVLQRVLDGRVLLLCVAPERLSQPQLQGVIEARAIRDGGLEFLVFDEAHCVIEWGYGFRPGYLKGLKYLRDRLMSLAPTARLLLLSATVTGRTRDALANVLTPSSSTTQQGQPFRAIPEHVGWPMQEYIDLSVVRLDDDEDGNDPQDFVARRTASLQEALSEGDVLKKRTSAAIVFCRRRAETEVVADVLSGHGQFAAEAFHAGMSALERSEAYDRIRRRQTRLIASTCAFGMGMDVPHLHRCVHLSPPASIEQLIQEVGRIGRSRAAREASGFERVGSVVLAARSDVERLRELDERQRIRSSEVQEMWDKLRSERGIQIAPEREVVFVDEGLIGKPRQRRVTASNFDRMLFWLEEAGLLTVEGNMPRAIKLKVHPNVLRDLRTSSGDLGAIVTELLDLSANGASESEHPKTSQQDTPVRRGWFERLLARFIGVVFPQGPAKPNRGGDASRSERISETAAALPYATQWMVISFARFTRVIARSTAEKRSEGAYQLQSRVLHVLKRLHRNGAIHLQQDLVFRPLKRFQDAKQVMVDLKKRAATLLNRSEILTEDFERITAVRSDQEPSDGLPVSVEELERRAQIQREDRILRALFRELRIIERTPLGEAQSARFRRRYPFGSNRAQEGRLFQALFAAAERIVKRCEDQLAKLDDTAREVEINLGWLLGVLPQTRKVDALEMFKHVVLILRGLRVVDCFSTPLPSSRVVTLLTRRHVDLVGEGNVSEADAIARNRIQQLEERECEGQERLRALDMLLAIDSDADRQEFIEGYFKASSRDELHQLLQSVSRGVDLERLVTVSDSTIGTIQEERTRQCARWLQELSSDVKRSAAQDPADARILVNAGPGSGKTHLLISRAIVQIGQGMRPSEILILAFNRAVVDDIRRRVVDALRGAGYGSYGRQLECKTFHSFAVRWLARWGIPCRVDRGSDDFFNVKLKQFVAEICKSKERLWEVVSGKRMVMIDEWQDCNSTRWAFVSQLLSLPRLGMLCIGDDDQDILGYERKKAGEQSRNYFLALEKEIPDIRKYQLRENRRSNEEIVRHSQAFMREAKLPDRLKDKELVSAQAVRGSPLQNGQHVDVVGNGGTTNLPSIVREFDAVGHRNIAVLVRTRDEALARYKVLNKQLDSRFSVRLWGGDDLLIKNLREFGLYEQALRTETRRTLQFEDEVEHRVGTLQLPGCAVGSSSKAFDRASIRISTLLRGLLRVQGVLRTRDIIEAIQEMKLAELESWVRGDEASDGVNVSVRTIHSAKGLQFDAVVLCPSSLSFRFDHRERADEVRLWYVGITRARHCLVDDRGPREQAWLESRSHFPKGGSVAHPAAELGIGDIDISTFGDQERRWKLWRHEFVPGEVLEYRPSGGGQFYSPKVPGLGLGRLSRKGRELLGATSDISRWRIVEVGLKWQTEEWLERVRKVWVRYPGWHCLPWQLERV